MSATIAEIVGVALDEDTTNSVIAGAQLSTANIY